MSLFQGHTAVLVGIKAEIGKPRPMVPDEGYLEFFVDWYVWCLITFINERLIENKQVKRHSADHVIRDDLKNKFYIML